MTTAVEKMQSALDAIERHNSTGERRHQFGGS